MRITGELTFHAEEGENHALVKVAAWVGYMRAKGYDVDEVVVAVTHGGVPSKVEGV